MSKAMAEGQDFVARSGSFSTHGSRTGANLLGWGEDEVLTDEQKRAALVKAKMQIDAEIFATKEYIRRFPSRHDIKQKNKILSDLSIRATYLSSRLSEFKKMSNNKGDDIGDFIIRVAQSKMTRHQWNCIMNEARALFELERDGQTAPIGSARLAVAGVLS